MDKERFGIQFAKLIENIGTEKAEELMSDVLEISKNQKQMKTLIIAIKAWKEILTTD